MHNRCRLFGFGKCLLFIALITMLVDTGYTAETFTAEPDLVKIQDSGLDVCLLTKARRTFMQLYRKDAVKTSDEVNEIFLNLKRLGFNEVVLQWTSYDEFSLYASQLKGSQSVIALPRFIRAAKNNNIKLWIGTHYANDYWKALSLSDNDLQKFLQQSLLDLKKRLETLVPTLNMTIANNDIVAGWYISDELDDFNWNTAQREKILFEYLAEKSSLLRKAKPEWPIAISAFSNGIRSAVNLKVFFERILQDTYIQRIWFQDGVGVRKLSLAKYENYANELSKISQSYPDGFGIVNEIFVPNLEKNEERANTTTSLSNLLKQLSIASAVTRDISIFSAPDYLLNDADNNAILLYNQWLKSAATCRQ